MYSESMKNQKFPVGLPKPPSNNETHQSLLHAIGGVLYMKIFNEKLLPFNKSKLIKNNIKSRK